MMHGQQNVKLWLIRPFLFVEPEGSLPCYKEKYIEKNLCITLVIHQESLHDAFTKNHYTMHGQQNVKFYDYIII